MNVSLRPLSLFRTACLVGTLSLAACGETGTRDVRDADRSYPFLLTERLVNARPGDVIDIPEGVFAFDRPLALTVDGLTLRGQGADRTILSFQDQVMGEEGLLVTARNITLENLAIEDPIGDGVSISQSENVVIRGLRVEWTDGPDADNGAYGIAPIGSTNVLVEDSIAIGAAAAGIHVGQSHNVVIRRNRAERNRVGIQIENTTDCDLYENVATGNSGGILVTASPAQPASIGSTRIFDNHVFDNNFESFGRTDTAAARLPTGSGIALQASDQVEIFGNVIADHRSANMIIAALTEAGQPILDVGAGFDPYPETLHVHDNDFRGGGLNPDGLELQVLRLVIAGPLGRMPDILWDGYLDPAKLVDGQMPDSLRICIDNGTADIVDADPQGGRASPRIVTDAHRCTHPPLPAIHLDFATPAGVGTD